MEKKQKRSKRAQIGGKWIRPEKRQGIVCMDERRCRLCGKDEATLAELGRRGLSLDHIALHSQGGSNEANNLITICVGCNNKRNAKSLAEWLQALRQDKNLRAKIGGKRIAPGERVFFRLSIVEISRYAKEIEARLASGMNHKWLKANGWIAAGERFLAKRKLSLKADDKAA